MLKRLIFSATVVVYDSNGEFERVKLDRNWSTDPLPADLREQAALYKAEVEEYLRPGDQEQIALRLAALRGHWNAAEDDQAVQQLMAIDWQRSLGVFPLWAVTQACEDWIDNQRKRPMISDIRKLCGDAVEEYVMHVDILAKALEA